MEEFKKMVKLAESHNTQAQCCLAYAYEKGEGVEEDMEAAFTWYGRAADGGDACAMFNLALMYLQGRGVKKNAAMGLEYMTKAAVAGDAEAMCRIGCMLLEGETVKVDVDKALEWFYKSATLGNSRAQNNLGVMYCTGRGVIVKDYAVARDWFEKAAHAGDEQAKANLALLDKEMQQVAAVPELETVIKRAKKKTSFQKKQTVSVAPRSHATRSKVEARADAGTSLSDVLSSSGRDGDQTSSTTKVKGEKKSSTRVKRAKMDDKDDDEGPDNESADQNDLEKKARMTFLMYNKHKTGVMTKDEFVLCWTELTMLDDSFSDQEETVERLEGAFVAMTGGKEKRLPKEDFFQFYLKAVNFSLKKSIDVLLKTAASRKGK